MLKGTPMENYSSMFNSVEEARQELRKHFAEKREGHKDGINSVKKKYFAGEFDEVKVKEAKRVLHDLDSDSHNKQEPIEHFNQGTNSTIEERRSLETNKNSFQKSKMKAQKFNPFDEEFKG